MKRAVYKELTNWAKDSSRKPLILRGARQVGKSYLVKELQQTFNNHIELNFEERPELAKIFQNTLEIDEILKKITAILKQKITPGETLIFFDEVQLCPAALTSLRYFYEKRPDIHVIAAGSLIEFAIEDVGLPVGRVRSLYMHPMTFHEFLMAVDEYQLIEYLTGHDNTTEIDEVIHERMKSLLADYFAVGGMPEAVKMWSQTKDLNRVQLIHSDLIDTFRQDFSKYAKKGQIKYIDKVFNAIPKLSGKKFVFSSVDESLRARELRPALEK